MSRLGGYRSTSNFSTFATTSASTRSRSLRDRVSARCRSCRVMTTVVISVMTVTPARASVPMAVHASHPTGHNLRPLKVPDRVRTAMRPFPSCRLGAGTNVGAMSDLDEAEEAWRQAVERAEELRGTQGTRAKKQTGNGQPRVSVASRAGRRRGQGATSASGAVLTVANRAGENEERALSGSRLQAGVASRPVGSPTRAGAVPPGLAGRRRCARSPHRSPRAGSQGPRAA